MKIAVLGGTGRTGILLVQQLLDRGHQLTVLVRDPAKAEFMAERVTLVTGDSRSRENLTELLSGADAVASALGPVGRDDTLLRDTARGLIEAMTEEGVTRYVGISVAGLTLPGDRKRGRDKVISWLLNTLGGELAKDKIAEYDAWHSSTIDWTLVRVPRLVEAPASTIEADPHRSGRRTSLSRANLAAFIADATENGSYPRQAPFVTNT